MTNPNQPQDRFYWTKYSNSAFGAFNETDLLQVMALSTSAVIDNLEGATGKLNSMSVMYTPMDSGEYVEFGTDTLS